MFVARGPQRHLITRVHKLSLIEASPASFVFRCQLNQTTLHSAEAIERVALAMKNGGLVNQRWDYIIFAFDMSFASQHLSSLGGWDEARRQTVRKVLAEARNNVHVHPRPWWAR